jgi:hypothetical protein
VCSCAWTGFGRVILGGRRRRPCGFGVVCVCWELCHGLGSPEPLKRTRVPPARSCATQLGLDHVCHEDQLVFLELRREELSESVYTVEGTHNQYILQMGCKVEVAVPFPLSSISKFKTS